ncbi:MULTISPECIES: CapA family protein [Streptomycetaceae]|nr:MULTISPECIES: CapA family protein [Streptomycetaceae]MYS57245.1 CapA family protein [Streptomyces sp. SID5468]CCB72802.1 Bacterial capsule synthesis protein PGA_cap [Streptantibioticus cattleyicolor NRRL 8057 = DSM 46488]
MTVRLALAGDTMLGREVAGRLARCGADALFAPEVGRAAAAADLFVLNLECCVSDRGAPAPVPGKPFFFRAPPGAVRALAGLGVDAVTLANNHALDFGPEALADTRELLAGAGIAAVGAGPDVAAARAPAVLTAGGVRVGLLGVTDHPEEFAAGPDRPGTAYADLWSGVPGWLTDAVAALRERCDVAVVTVHWGPNMTPRPVAHVRRCAPGLLAAGATVVAGHSAHVPHGFTRRVLYDLGDFIDDYAVHPVLRNDLGVLWLVTLDGPVVRRVDAVPLALDFCHTRRAVGAEYAWMRDRLTSACAELGTPLGDMGDRLTARWV